MGGVVWGGERCAVFEVRLDDKGILGCVGIESMVSVFGEISY
jgi:hypothetical protein